MKPSKNGLTFTKKIKEGGLPGMYDLKKIWNPTWFQGNRKKSGYFEGWYCKVVSHEGKQSWAFIPGISLSKGDDHSFVQVINGKTGNTWYYRFPLDAFSYSKEGFHVQIANNNFSSKHMTLDLDSDQGRFQGDFLLQAIMYTEQNFTGQGSWVGTGTCHLWSVIMEWLALTIMLKGSYILVIR
jgi:hypothetical protein